MALEALELLGRDDVACWLVLASRSIQARLATEQSKSRPPCFHAKSTVKVELWETGLDGDRDDQNIFWEQKIGNADWTANRGGITELMIRRGTKQNPTGPTALN